MQNYSVGKEFKTQLTDEALFSIQILFHNENICCGAHNENAKSSNEHPQHILLSKNRGYDRIFNISLILHHLCQKESL